MESFALQVQEELPERVRRYVGASLAPASREIVGRGWRVWTAWCEARGVVPLTAPPEALAGFLTWLADEYRPAYSSNPGQPGLKVKSIETYLFAINTVFRLHDLPRPGQHPLVARTLAGIRRVKGTRSSQVEPLTLDVLARVRWPRTLRGVRDRALILVGYAGALRESELAALQVEPIRETRHGVQVFVARSKTDQQAEGAWVDITRFAQHAELCPVAALGAWLAATRLTSGPVFRPIRGLPARALSRDTIQEIVKQAVASAGEDARRYSGHSLRAGRATDLATSGVPVTLIARHGRWKTLDMVLRYARHETGAELAGTA